MITTKRHIDGLWRNCLYHYRSIVVLALQSLRHKTSGQSENRQFSVVYACSEIMMHPQPSLGGVVVVSARTQGFGDPSDCAAGSIPFPCPPPKSFSDACNQAEEIHSISKPNRVCLGSSANPAWLCFFTFTPYL